ncbi:hypothetical protein Q7P35_010408 [Cladosporium inversicolor]
MAESCLEGTDAASIRTCDSSILPPTFLKLPIELRDEIYSHVASTEPASTTITFNPQPGVTASHVYHGLLPACKQTRKEYTRALLRFSGIAATIENFDFQPLVAFISQLPSTFLDSLPKQLAPLELTASQIDYVNPRAKVHILVKITDDIPAALQGLQRWQIKQQSLEAIGSRFKVTYRFIGRSDLQLRLGVQLSELMEKLEGSNDAITQAELKAMMRALLKGVAFHSDPEEAAGALFLLEATGLSPSTINQFVTMYRSIRPNHAL